MSTWEKSVITGKGYALLSKLHSGTPLTITRAAAGAQSVTADELKTLESVPDERQELIFSTVSYPDEQLCAIPVKLYNYGLTDGYVAQVIGLYAEDPDDGEILYMVTRAANGGTEVPAESEMPYTASWILYVKFGPADGVSITADPSSSVTLEDVQALIDTHTEDTAAHTAVLATKEELAAHLGDKENPHGMTAAQLGLGNVDNTSDASKPVSSKQAEAIAKAVAGITAESLGLGNVNNTADTDKNVAFASEAGEARKLQNALTIRLNGGRTEGTNQFTFDGSVSKSVNITPEKTGALPLDGGTMTGPLTLDAIILTSASYGASLPASGTAGQLFFKKVT